MSEKTMHLGDRSSNGLTIEITRGFDDGVDEVTKKAITYICHGVDDISVDDPWQIGGGRECVIRVEFSTGEDLHLHGVITDAYTTTQQH